MNRFLIDERLNADLVAIAKAGGYDAEYVPHIGKAGWQDWNLGPFAVDNDYIVVTLNRRDFLRRTVLPFGPRCSLGANAKIVNQRAVGTPRRLRNCGDSLIKVGRLPAVGPNRRRVFCELRNVAKRTKAPRTEVADRFGCNVETNSTCKPSTHGIAAGPGLEIERMIHFRLARGAFLPVRQDSETSLGTSLQNRRIESKHPEPPQPKLGRWHRPPGADLGRTPPSYG